VKMSFEQAWDILETEIKKPSFRQNKGLGNEVGYYIFDYPEQMELDIRDRIQRLIKKSSNSADPYKIVVFDLYDIIIDSLEERGFMDQCQQIEKEKGFVKISEAVGKMLHIDGKDNLIVEKIRNDTPNEAIIFITGVGKAFPILRSHNILNNLHQKIDDVPVVMFYPGEYDGKKLVLMSKIDDNNYYRAFKLIDWR